MYKNSCLSQRCSKVKLSVGEMLYCLSPKSPLKAKSRSTNGISSWLGSVNEIKRICGAAGIKLRKTQLTVH